MRLFELLFLLAVVVVVINVLTRLRYRNRRMGGGPEDEIAYLRQQINILTQSP
jgi:hypothetical protein